MSSVRDRLVSREIVGEAAAAVQYSMLARDLSPRVSIERREMRVAFEVAMDLGQIKKLSERQRRAVQCLASNDKNRIRHFGPSDGIIQRSSDGASRSDQIALACDDDVLSTRQRVTKRRRGVSAHDDAVPRGQRAEPAQIVRQPPWQMSVDANDAV